MLQLLRKVMQMIWMMHVIWMMMLDEDDYDTCDMDVDDHDDYETFGMPSRE